VATLVGRNDSEASTLTSSWITFTNNDLFTHENKQRIEWTRGHVKLDRKTHLKKFD